MNKETGENGEMLSVRGQLFRLGDSQHYQRDRLLPDSGESQFRNYSYLLRYIPTLLHCIFSTKKDLFSIIKRVNLAGFGILHKTILIPSKALSDDW